MPHHLEARFLAKVNNGVPLPPDICWPWTGEIGEKGYGVFAGGEVRPHDRNRHKKIRAHRWAFHHFVRPITPAEHVLHRCDDPACVNWIRCLYAGDNDQNVRDRVTRGRDGGHLRRGEAHGRAKITLAQVIEARERRVGGETIRALADEFKISPTQMARILRGENWNH